VGGAPSLTLAKTAAGLGVVPARDCRQARHARKPPGWFDPLRRGRNLANGHRAGPVVYPCASIPNLKRSRLQDQLSKRQGHSECVVSANVKRETVRCGCSGLWQTHSECVVRVKRQAHSECVLHLKRLSKRSDVDLREYQGTTSAVPKDDARFNAVKSKNNEKITQNNAQNNATITLNNLNVCGLCVVF
jgi:hypothetical protein